MPGGVIRAAEWRPPTAQTSSGSAVILPVHSGFRIRFHINNVLIGGKSPIEYVAFEFRPSCGKWAFKVLSAECFEIRHRDHGVS